MDSKRAPRRDKDVDTARTIFWFRLLGDYLGTYEPREIQRVVAPNTIGIDSRGGPIRNNKFLGYSRGEHVPLQPLALLAEQAVPRSFYVLNHPLWMVLRTQGWIRNPALNWLRQLDPEIQGIVLSPLGKSVGGPSRHTLGSLERRASLDSLAALTIMLRLNHERGESEWAWLCAQSIFRVLLILGPLFDRRTIANDIFQLYIDRVFCLVTFDGRRVALNEYDYATKAWLLHQLSADVREKLQPFRERRLPSSYALNVLDGKYHQRFWQCFQIPLGADA